MSWLACLLLSSPPDCFGLPPYQQCTRIMMTTLAIIEKCEAAAKIGNSWRIGQEIEGWRRVFRFWHAASVVNNPEFEPARRWEAWFLLHERLQ